MLSFQRMQELTSDKPTRDIPNVHVSDAVRRRHRCVHGVVHQQNGIHVRVYAACARWRYRDGPPALAEARRPAPGPGLRASRHGTARPKGVGITLSFLVDTTSVDDMATNLSNIGVEMVEGPVTRPWNTREIVVRDPDDYTLVFFEPVDITRSFEDVMGNVSDGSAGHTPPT